RKVILPGKIVRFGEFFAHKDVKGDNGSVYSALVRHAHDLLVEVLPFLHFLFIERTRFRKMPWPYHIHKGIKHTEREGVESIFSHHIQKCFPVSYVSNRFKVLVECRTGTIRIPGGIVFYGPERIARFLRTVHDILKWGAITHIFSKRQATVNQAAIVSALYRDDLSLRDDGESFFFQRTMNKQVDQEIITLTVFQ